VVEKRFDNIMTAFVLPSYQLPEEPRWMGRSYGQEDEAWQEQMAGCMKFLDLLTEGQVSWGRWQQAISPGGWLVIDESMAAWLGVLIKMPGRKVIKRKPPPHPLALSSRLCAVV
jgi:hypothetical protein